MLAKLKTFLTSSPPGKRVTHYAEIFAATFGLAAVASAENVAALHQPLTWSVLFGIAAAGVKAVIDIAKPLLVAWFTKITTGG